MEEIKLTTDDIKHLIDTGTYINEGSEGCLFTYNGRLIKMDPRMYHLLKVNNPIFSKDIIMKHYKYDKNDYQDRDQLEELYKRQPKIRTKVPEGIITIKDSDSEINGISPGIILHHFIDYELLSAVSIEDYKRLLILLRKTFDDIKNLADNEIAHEDLFERHAFNRNHYNILQKGNDPQIIDMSGTFIKVGNTFKGTKKMYKDFADLINYYNEMYGLEQMFKYDGNITEEKLELMLKDLERHFRRKK